MHNVVTVTHCDFLILFFLPRRRVNKLSKIQNNAPVVRRTPITLEADGIFLQSLVFYVPLGIIKVRQACCV